MPAFLSGFYENLLTAPGFLGVGNGGAPPARGVSISPFETSGISCCYFCNKRKGFFRQFSSIYVQKAQLSSFFSKSVEKINQI